MQAGSLVLHTNAIGIVQSVSHGTAKVLLKNDTIVSLPVKQLVEVVNPFAQANLIQHQLLKEAQS